jgi:uncharacterized YigZ family protein
VDPWSYLAPESASSAELKEQGSRFIAHLAPAGSPVAALALLESLRKRYHDATHHCWAYRTGWGEDLQSRSSDDGEPSHTAGEPILKSLEEKVVSDAALVVVRYFGGVKLGTGGLVRAYRTAARMAIEGARLGQRTLTEEWLVTLPYGAQGSLHHAAEALGVTLGEQAFAEDVTVSVRVSRGVAVAFAARLERLCEQWKGAVRWKSK